MIEIKNANLNVMAAFIIKIGELQLTAEAQMWVYKNKDGTKTVDADFADITEITYMGIPIVGYENFNKFKKFHKEMGIDFDKAINEEYEKVMGDDAVKELAKKITF